MQDATFELKSKPDHSILVYGGAKCYFGVYLSMFHCSSASNKLHKGSTDVEGVKKKSVSLCTLCVCARFFGEQKLRFRLVNLLRNKKAKKQTNTQLFSRCNM